MKSFCLAPVFLFARLTLVPKTNYHQQEIGFKLFFWGSMMNWCNTIHTPAGFLCVQWDAYFVVVQGLSYEHRHGAE